MNSWHSNSPQDTLHIGQMLAQTLEKGQVILLIGPLGAGKTTLVKGIVASHCHLPIEAITSPTYSYVQHYHGPLTLHHFDLYRIASPQQFLDLGLDEFLSPEAVSLIEWPEHGPNLAQHATHTLTLSYTSEYARQITLTKKN